ncbi:MAG TPA: M48 family metalloprotease [Sphingomonadaceae bacterium]|nr:M48 family metalloprotease [Sphingomonadaceae bacterium]
MRLLARLIAVLAALQLAIQPVAAQSILRDAETEAFLQELMDPLTVAAGMPAGSVDVVLLHDNSINAFVAGGQRIYIHSGLIDAADTPNEVQGVLAHELGHITGGHIVRFDEGIRAASNISILSTLLGVVALAAGAGEAAMGIMAAGQQAALGKFLAFSRVQESSADAAGVEYLSKAGISGRGSIDFFKKLQNLEFRYGYSQDDEDGYSRTHPLSGDRIAFLQREYEEDPAWNAAEDPRLQAEFDRVKAKLYGYLAEPAETLRNYPASMTGVPARYARAYAYHKDARINEALEELDGLLEIDPHDPYFLEIKGQILLESGRPREALDPLREATSLTNNAPLIASLFGHALIATEDARNFDEAEQVLKAAVARDREIPFAWYQLGVVYAARGDMPRARLASAEQQVMSRQYELALRSAEAARLGLPEGSADWIRSQDIANEARFALEQQEERR